MFVNEKLIFLNNQARLTAGIVVVIFLAGCSTPPAPLPPKVSAGLDGLRAEGVSLRGQIEKTIEALKDLMLKPQGDYAPQFESFSHELGILETGVDQARQQRAATESVIKDQFMAWDENLKQLKNEETRIQAAVRRVATEATYADIEQKISELKKEWGPFITDLRDTRQYLKGDLSQAGLETMKPTVERIYERKTSVIRGLDSVIDALSNAMRRT
jgi:hypothetical protein